MAGLSSLTFSSARGFEREGTKQSKTQNILSHKEILIHFLGSYIIKHKHVRTYTYSGSGRGKGCLSVVVG